MKIYYSFYCLFLASALFGFGRAWGQAPANDDPCGAVALTPQGPFCTTVVSGTTQGATTTVPTGYLNNGGCGAPSSGTGNPKDVWYTFTTTASGLGSTGATVTVSGNAAGQLRLFAAATCAGPFTDVACAAATAGSTTAPALTTAALTPSTRYYVRVSGYSGNDPTGPFAICVTDGPGSPPVCQGPALGLPVYSAGNTAATVGFAPLATNAGPYTATLLIGTAVVQTFPATPPSIALTNLVPGNIYTLRVTGTCPAGGQFQVLQSLVVRAPNDEPCTAQPLVLDLAAGCTPVSGTTRTSSTTLPVGYTNPGCGGSTQPADVWYTFRTTASGAGSTGAVLTVNNVEAAGQVRLFAAPSCAGPFSALACSTGAVASDGALPLTATGLVPNTTYYVSVAPAAFRAGGFFTICASAAPPTFPCVTPTISVPTATVTATSALVTFAIPAGGNPAPSSFTLTYTPQSGGGAMTATVPYVPVFVPGGLPQYLAGSPLTGLQPGTTYLVTVQTNCPGGAQSGTATATFTTQAATVPQPPVNDECSGAITLPVTTACTLVATTNLNASVQGLTGINPTCGYYLGADVWYQLVVPANGIVQVTTGAVSGSVVTDTGLALYTGSCGTLTEVDCNDDLSATNLFSQVRATGLPPGSTVYAQVWRTGSLVGGAFTICATTDLTCPVVTNLLAAAVGQTTATLTFTLPAGGTGYTLTYTPAGGAPQTQTVTASPVLLTGLLPNTRYAVSLTGTCSGALPATATTSFTTLATPSCAPPAAVYVGNLTATTVGVGFVLNAAATGYAVTYQAAGGSVQTVAPVPTASPVTLTGLTPGTSYTVCVSSACANGLTSAPVCATVFSTPLASRNAALSAHLGLFPNPAHRTVTLTVPAALLRQAGLYTLSDALGRTVRQRFITPAPGTAAETRAELDLLDLPAGVYVVRLLSSAGPLTQRLVIE